MSINVVDPGGVLQIANALVYAPTGGRTIFVHSGFSGLSDMPPGMDARTSVQSALLLARSGRGDVIQLLPGHTESLAAADSWSNLGSATGVTIKGPPCGPPAVITWSAATSTLLMDTADLCIDGGREDGDFGIVLAMEPGTGTVTVAAPITVTGARCAIKRCQIRLATDASNLVTDAIHVNAVTDFLLKGNFIYGTTGTPTTVLKSTGAVHRLRILNNHIAVPIVTAATGVLIDVSNAAATELQVAGNLLDNKTATAKFVMKPHASTRGEVTRNRVRIDDTGTAATALGMSTFTTLLGFFNNDLVDDDGLASVQMGTAAS